MFASKTQNTREVDGWAVLRHHMAYLCVHSLANWPNRSRSVLYIRAISGTSGSSGLGSVNSEQIDNSTETTKS